jgi:hypothetical protein
MGRWPAQGDEKHFSSNCPRWKRRPPLCHLDRSAAQWRDLRSLYPELTLRAITTLPFVISTGAQRSGEISVWMLLLGNVFLGTHTLFSS